MDTLPKRKRYTTVSPGDELSQEIAEIFGLNTLHLYHPIFLITVFDEDATGRTFNFDGTINHRHIERIHDWFITEEEANAKMAYLVADSIYEWVYLKEYRISQYSLKEFHFGKSMNLLATIPHQSKKSMITDYHRLMDTGDTEEFAW